MIAPLHHRSPTSGGHGTARHHQPPVNSVRRAGSRLPRLRGWRGGAGTIAVAVIFALLGTAHAAQLTLTWADASTNEDGFKVERKTSTTGAYGQLTTVAAGTTAYVDATVTAGTTYCYRVRAYNSAGDSSYSNEACAAAATVTSYTVAVTKAGAGSGTIASSPSAIDCGSTCSASVASGTSIALSATPTAGSTFTGWSGACTGTGNCALVVDAAKSLTATFAPSAPTTYTLTLTKTGTGSGTVTSPSGINCGSTCSASYSSGTSVTLTATPTTGSTFTGWSGACTGTGTCSVSMTAARSVTATFTKQTYALTVTKVGTGSGTVTSTPSGINCGSTCGASYASGTSVTLVAAPTTGSTFTGWSGAGCSGTGTCVVTTSAAQSVTATFVLSATATYGLSVAKSGGGTGIVASNPGGINCGSTCSAYFTTGTNVTLEALPDAGSTFTGWSGACTGAASCTVPMGQAQTVTATFALQVATLAVAQSGPGNGTITSVPGGIACSSACSASFPLGTTVALTVTAENGVSFGGWSGACTGTGVCTVTLNQSKSVTAKFNRRRK